MPVKVLHEHIPDSVLFARCNLHAIRNLFHHRCDTCFFCQFPAELIVQTLFKIGTDLICFSCAILVFCQCRHSCIKIFSISHQHFCCRWFHQFTEIAAPVRPGQMQTVLRNRNSFVPFPIVQAVNLHAPKSHYIQQSVRRSAKETKIRLIYNSGPVRCQESAASGHKLPYFFRPSFPLQINHRRCHDLIVRKALRFIDDINIQAESAEGAV